MLSSVAKPQIHVGLIENSGLHSSRIIQTAVIPDITPTEVRRHTILWIKFYALKFETLNVRNSADQWPSTKPSSVNI